MNISKPKFLKRSYKPFLIGIIVTILVGISAFVSYKTIKPFVVKKHKIPQLTSSPSPTSLPSPKLTASKTIELNKNYLVHIVCVENDSNVFGSGVIIGKKNNDILILTNYHIVENFKRNSSGIPNCIINHWESEEYYYAEPIILDSFQKEDMQIIDFALLKILPEPKIDYFILNEDGTETKSTKPTTLLSLNSFPTICYSDGLNTGEEIVVLGFPAIGGTYISDFGQVSSFTVTEGIISSEFSEDKWYVKTSAKIDEGNSGGGAFSTEHGCLVGMPTFSTVGEIESLGRMLNVRKLLTEYLFDIRSSN